MTQPAGHDHGDGIARRDLLRAGAALGLVGTTAAAIPVGTAERAAAAVRGQQQDAWPAQQVDDLLARLTLDEKVSLLHQYQPAIPRLGMPAFRTGTEALHGVAWLGPATVFPQALGLATTWDPELIERVGSVVGDEARGYHKKDPSHNGLNLWAPVVNLLCDPRWGRNEEGYSEDPHLTAVISTAYAGGMAGDDPHYLKAAPTLKHYVAYNNEQNRVTSDSIVPPRVLHDYYNRAFKPAISADAATGVMTSYNFVNGRPASVNPDMAGMVRQWTGKGLLIVTDAFGPGDLTGAQDFYETQAEANEAILHAGADSFTDDGENSEPTIKALHDALARGLLSEAEVDEAVRHILDIRFRLGDLGGPWPNPYEKITPGVINRPAHQWLARETAGKAMVLLKNANATLPLDPARLGKVAVVGPLVKTLYQDWYSGTMPYRVTPLDGVTERLGEGVAVTSSEGVDRVALRDAATGAYVTASADAAGAMLAARSDSAGRAQAIDIFDWGVGVHTLRTVANGKYVSLGDGHSLVNDAAQPNGWYVQQQFTLEQQPDGTYVLGYTGYDVTESWFGEDRYVAVGGDGTLSLGAAAPKGAARFELEVLSSGVDSAADAAREADTAIVVVRSMPFINGREAYDRPSIDLARGQQDLVEGVRAANPNTIVVLENSYPTAITWANERVPAILWTTHAGQETGHAVADVLFGDRTPAGRLTQTWYRSTGDLPGIFEYDIIKHDRTYLYHQGEVLYPFGYGLSYTTFAYDHLRLSSHRVHADERVEVSVDVTNTGSRAGDEVVQLYVRHQQSRVKQPLKALRGFQRVHLAPGQQRTVTLPVAAADLAFWDVTRGKHVVESGTYEFQVGGSSADIRASRRLRVEGETIPPRDLGRSTQAQDFDDYARATLAPVTRATGTAVAAAEGGAWLQYADADLRHGTARFTAEVAKPSGGAGSIEVRVHDPERGPLLGTLRVPSTGGSYSWTSTSEGLRMMGGRHDLYLVLSADVRISSFSIKGARQ